MSKSMGKAIFPWLGGTSEGKEGGGKMTRKDLLSLIFWGKRPKNPHYK